MTALTTVFVALGALGSLGGIATLIVAWPTIRKMRAETRKVDVEAAVAEDAGHDARWQAMLKEQRESLIDPLSKEVERLSGEVEQLREGLRSMTSRYRAAIRTLRAYVAWIAEHMPDETPPPIPPELADDL